MGSQWENFQRNLGEWRGSFADLDTRGALLRSSASILTLEPEEEGRCVSFRLRRFGEGGYDAPPTHDHAQEYRSLGRQVVFFDNGAFCKGSLQIAPGTRTGAEYGFIGDDRRLRLVQLHDEQGVFESLVLIREFRAGGQGFEREPLRLEQLQGTWAGEAAIVEADWSVPTAAASRSRLVLGADGQVALDDRVGTVELSRQGHREDGCVRFDAPEPYWFTPLPDGGWSLVPLQRSHRGAFTQEAGWLLAPDRRQRLIRRYDDRGAWISSTFITETRVG